MEHLTPQFDLPDWIVYDDIFCWTWSAITPTFNHAALPYPEVPQLFSIALDAPVHPLMSVMLL